MPTPIVQVDAFTAEPFGGNPAAVCVLDAPATDPWMRSVAAEMNLSETAFAVRPSETGRPWGLRWFTPEVEVDLCGHATLATAHVLFADDEVDGDVVAFTTRSGELRARRLADGWIELDLPADPPRIKEAPIGLIDALGLDPTSVLAVAQGSENWLVHLATADDVVACRPDFRALDPIAYVMVTAAGSDGVDFVSRFFAPRAGIDEDPVTGSAHCLLGPYWSARLRRTELSARQVSARGGTLRVTFEGDRPSGGERNRVRVAGQATTVLRGVLTA